MSDKTFLSSYSNLCSEWHPTKNGELLPKMVSIGSEKKVWWLGKCGHEWKSSIAKRVQGQQCPYCSNKVVLKGFNDLATTNPNLALEWHPTKNNGLYPTSVFAGSRKEVWWLGKCGHEWQAAIVERNKGTNCPFCANKKVLVGYNDLSTTNPNLALEWHPTKNGSLTPQMIMAGSGKKAWWLGKCGHEWQAAIVERNNGTKCPFCANKKVLVGYNDLSTKNPDLAAEWHPTKNGELTAQSVTAKSNVLVWWLGKCGHEWKAKVSNRANGRGCPYCKNRLILDGFNDLASTNPELAADWHPEKNKGLTIKSVTAGSAKRVWWLGKCGHEWQAPLVERLAGKGCPFCSSERVLPGFNDLGTRNPELAREWHPTKNGNLTPNHIMSKSNQIVWWLGKCGHEWQAAVNNRSAGNGCPICAKEGQTSYPEQAIFYYVKKAFPDAINGDRRYKIEFDVFIPSIKTAIEYDGQFWHQNLQKDLKKNQLCKDNSITLIRIREKGCPLLPKSERFIICETGNTLSLQSAIYELLVHLGVSVSVDIERDNIEILALKHTNRMKNSISQYSSTLSAEWHQTKNGNLTPQMIMAGSGKKVWWLGKCGHEWQATPNSRTTSDAGCPYCHGKKTLIGINDLATVNPELAAEWHTTKNGSLVPQMFREQSGKKVWWLCKKGHEWQTSISNRTKGSKCPICCNQKVLSGYNDLASINPDLAAEWHPTKNAGLTPDKVTPKSNKKAWWLGRCGHEWEASIFERNNGTGCPYCNPSAAVRVTNIDTQITYPSLNAAAKSCGLKSGRTISLCCNGQQKTAGGYHWEYSK